MRNWRALTSAVCLSTSNTMKGSSSRHCARIRSPLLRGVVFDMDGTLTVPNLDFQVMYERCGVETDQDILQVLRTLPPEEASAKYTIIEQMEEEATRTMKVMPGAKEVMSWLTTHNIPMAVITRNTHISVQALQERLDSCCFDIVIARDNPYELPPKPNPAAMYYIAQQWKIDVVDDDDDRNALDSILMVGDSLSNDIAFGHAAGTTTALLDNSRKNTSDTTTGTVQPDIIVQHLHDLPGKIWKQFDIDGRFGHKHPLLKYEPPKPTSVTTKAAFEGRIEDINLHEKNKPDDSGNTPLIWAADAGHDHVVAYLLDDDCYGRRGGGVHVDVDTRGYLGATAACRAARRGHVDVLERLCRAGANLDIPNDKLQYPLHFAAFQEHVSVVDVLLKHGVNTRVLDRKGRIPAYDTKNEDIRNTILQSMT